jgi:hypothetical protein
MPGMLLLHSFDKNKPPAECYIPGDSINEDDFLKAGEYGDVFKTLSHKCLTLDLLPPTFKAKQSGHAKMQLQLAAREGAARGLFDQTGIDVRHELDRLKPAVLRLNPPADASGTKYLKNEYENRLFYFLSIAEEDFLAEVSFPLFGLVLLFCVLVCLS